MSKVPVSEGTFYLHQCLVHSDCKINWQTVGDAIGINSSAASMRMTRLKDRIKKQGVATASKGWTGEVDQDARFLFQCIISCNCKIDYKKVGDALHVKPSAASMRFTRLKAKYASSTAADALRAARARIFHGQPTQQAEIVENKTIKRKTDESNDNSANEEVDFPKWKKVKSMAKEEADSETDVRTRKTADIASSDKRQTRGKVVDFKEIFEDSDSEDELSHIVPVDGSSDLYDDEYNSETSTEEDTDEDWSAEGDTDTETDSKTPIKKRGGLATPVKSPSTPRKVQSPRGLPLSPSQLRNFRGSHLISPNTPVGLSGIKVLQSHHTASHAILKSLPRPVKALSSASSSPQPHGSIGTSSLVSGSDLELSDADGSTQSRTQGSSLISETASERSEYFSAAASRKSSITGGDDETAAVQLHSELAKYVEEWKNTMDGLGDVIPSLEKDVDFPGRSLFNRLASWWK